jgi:hypothetical protein
MQFSELIIESRVDDFKIKHGKKFSPQNITKIIKTISPKYLDWVGKVMDDVNFDENFKTLVTALKRFDAISTNLPLTDINQYKTLNDLATSINTYNNRVRRDVKEVKGGKVVYDDGRFFVVNPLNYESSCYYGKGTKWCTAAETDSHFKRYNEDGKLFYIIDRTKPSSDPNYKVALLKKFDGDMSFYDAVDDRVVFDEVIGNDKFQEIIDSVDKFLQDVYPEQLKIYADAIAAKKEKERLEKLRIQQEMRAKYEETQENRELGYWSVGFDVMQLEGLKAHALLKWLDDYDDIEVRQPEDNSEIIRLETEIQRLDNEYDNSEDPRPELLDQKYELEDELEELKNKIDVYNILPTGEYYEMTEFEVLADGYEDKRYAVGTEREVQQSAYDSVEGLIDDVGYEGFSQSFLEDYIDTDELKRFVYDFYWEDVYESPESYLNDDQRELSDSQEDMVKIKEKTIGKLQAQIETLENQIGGDYDDEISEKVDELNDMISELEYEIDEIKENPEGDFSEELMEKIVKSRVDDVLYDPADWIKGYGFDLKDFIDQEAFIEGVIDADGYGHTLNRYDGSDDEISVNGTTFHIMRID